MAADLDRELHAVQNPALGAMLLWRCASAYSLSNERAEPIPMPALFLVLPIMFHRETAELVMSTQRASGLRMFVEKFQSAAQSKTDLLLAISQRAHVMRSLTAEALGIAIATHMIALDPNKAAALSLSNTPPIAGIPTSIRPVLNGAEKLGSWFGQVSLYETALLLQVTL